MGEILRLLHIEDSLGDAALTERSLTKAGYDVISVRVVTGGEVKSALARQTWDLIIADYRLPDLDAPTALSILQATGLDIPFIVVSGAIGEELAVALMRAGVQDYLLKDHLARLAPVVEREIRDARSRHERKDAERALGESQERLGEQSAALERQTVLLLQRDTLLREIHHRVKNNMQVMSSLLSLQTRAASNSETKRMLEENQHRIQSMALLHEMLYQSDNLATVDFPRYLRRMGEHLFGSYGVNSRQIRLVTELDPVELELDEALPSGLLISEVISNSLKHAFPEEREGEVRLAMRRRGPETVELSISDDGVGLPAGLDWASSRSLGLRLVRALAEQLGGKLDIRSDGGTHVELVFKTRPHGKLQEAEVGAGGSNRGFKLG